MMYNNVHFTIQIKNVSKYFPLWEIYVNEKNVMSKNQEKNQIYKLLDMDLNNGHYIIKFSYRFFSHLSKNHIGHRH